MDTIAGKDGKRLVLIPAGSFCQGSASGYAEEQPMHEVSVPAVYVDTHPVTNAEYRAYCDATGTPYPPNPRWPEYPDYCRNYPDHPVINVSWATATAYAAWAGKRLPTEAEWEYAARGGLAAPTYPWGDAPPTGRLANFADRDKDYAWKEPGTACGYRYTSPVGRFPPNGFGLYDMAGNVFEWTADWFFAYGDAVRDTAAFADGWGGSRVCRGGCYHSRAFDLRVARRRQILGGQANAAVGFRCVQDVTTPVAPPAATVTPPAPAANALASPELARPKDVELCVGVGEKLTLADAQRLRRLGVTSVEQYVTWETVENRGRDQWDFTHWDGQVAILKQAGLKWVPFLIAGPAYALPDWYRESAEFTGLRCLEHNLESKVQSLWDPRFRAYIERFLRKFAEHFLPAGVIQHPLLGITGDFGEAIYPVWHGNWPTNIPGLYHSHAGYWCHDRFARQDFGAKMQARYGDVAKLNAAWGTRFPAFAAVTPPALTVAEPDGFRVDEFTAPGTFACRTAADRRRWLDFVDWYRQAMTDYADFWLGTAARCFPHHPVYLCTGGNAEPSHGSHFAQQCQVAARHRGGVRITNEASVYNANFALTNWVASAATHYGAAFGFEPAGQVTAKGVVCRLYHAAATGANELHFYEGNIMGDDARLAAFAKYLPFLRRRRPVREIGVFYPDVPFVLGTTKWPEISANLALLRNLMDYAFVDDVTIADGILKKLKVVILCCGEFYRTATLTRLLEWVRGGGLLIGYNINQLVAVEDEQDWLCRFFDDSGGCLAVGAGTTMFLRLMSPEDLCREDAESRIATPLAAFLMVQGHLVSDGRLDNVFTTRFSDSLLLLNVNDGASDKTVTLPNGRTRTLTLPGNSITELPLNA